MSLPAVILVGGQGTRLRPLTDRTRKDMLPLVDRPLLSYTFEHLARHGVERAIISCGYLPDQIEAGFGTQHGGMALEYAVEDEPLGTGGAIGFAGRELESSFFALNGDSLREADLGEMVAFHRRTGAKATILLTPVADPSRYGLVRTAADGRVETFLEKPRPEATSVACSAQDGGGCDERCGSTGPRQTPPGAGGRGSPSPCRVPGRVPSMSSSAAERS